LQEIFSFLHNKIKKIFNKNRDMEKVNAFEDLIQKDKSFIIESGGSNLSNGEK